jgi:hypothetical protein
MSNLTGVHDSQFCAADNGQPCVMCAWAAEEERRHAAERQQEAERMVINAS